jgi:cytochrome c peroxidase
VSRTGPALVLILLCSLLSLARAAAEAPAPPRLPQGVSPVLWTLAVPGGTAPPPAMVALGEKLFRETRLSTNDAVACSTCHDPAAGFVDHKAHSEGVGAPKEKTQRNSPTVLNAMFNATQFWDGRAPTLEEQAKLPILNPIEMGQKSPDDVIRKVTSLPDYPELFQRVFGRAPTYDDLAAAIAAFERTQYAGDAPFDRFLAGDAKAIDASARRGWTLFNGKGRCNACHQFDVVNPLFSDQKFHNIGIAAHKTDFIGLARRAMGIVKVGDLKQIDELAIQSDLSELGRFLVTKQANDIGAFKTPTLRNVAVTAPYMHDGSLATLWDVMDHYNKGDGIENPFLDVDIQPLALQERDIDDLVALMAALTSPVYKEQAAKELTRQRQLSRTARPQRDSARAFGPKATQPKPPL